MTDLLPRVAAGDTAAVRECIDRYGGLVWSLARRLLYSTAEAEEAVVAARAFEQLSPEQQRCLRLSIYEGLSHDKISTATGLPLGTVKTHVRRGLIRIREALRENGLDPTGESQGAAEEVGG